jgi:hypothetical protein
MRHKFFLFTLNIIVPGLKAATDGSSADKISPTSVVVAGVGLALLAGAALLFGRDRVLGPGANYGPLQLHQPES